MCGALHTSISRKVLWGARLTTPSAVPATQHRSESGRSRDNRTHRLRREMALLQWGLVPSWSKDANADGGGLINARAKTLEQKPSFAESFLRRRCLIPADGFYEWKRNGKIEAALFLSDEG